MAFKEYNFSDIESAVRKSAKNYNMDNVIVYNDVKEAYNFIRGIKTREEVYALFENDLPDTYNEQ